MIIKSKSGVANLYAMVLVIFIAFGLIAIVLPQAINLTNKHLQKSKYEVMITSITELDNTITKVSANKYNSSKITINNPEELEIDCSNDKIKANIIYDLDFRNDTNTNVYGITINKEKNNLYFEKDYNNTLIDMDCNSFFFGKGENTIIISYDDFNSTNSKIKINIYRVTKDINYED
ncbi:MAG: hypothetical protein V1824_01480 [archaeon]